MIHFIPWALKDISDPDGIIVRLDMLYPVKNSTLNHEHPFCRREPNQGGPPGVFLKILKPTGEF